MKIDSKLLILLVLILIIQFAILIFSLTSTTQSIPVVETPQPIVTNTTEVPTEYDVKSIVIKVVLSLFIIFFLFMLYTLRRIRNKNIKAQREWEEQLLSLQEYVE